MTHVIFNHYRMTKINTVVVNFQVPVLQEKLYIGLEHAPPNFDVKNKIFGPMVSGYIHCMYMYLSIN